MSGTYQLFLDVRKDLYLNKCDHNNKSNYLTLLPDMESINECFKIYNANRQRKKNNWNEILKWVYVIQKTKTFKDYRIVFGTLTFDNKTLTRTCERTRTRYVSEFLSKQTLHYVANIDYGNKNDREHYHFLAMIKDNIDMLKWKYGGNKILQVPLSRKDIKATKNYLFKLNNHSYKESTRQKRIIRDRNNDSLIDCFANNTNEDFHKFKIEMSLFET